jgi:hypothetical protein
MVRKKTALPLSYVKKIGLARPSLCFCVARLGFVRRLRTRTSDRCCQGLYPLNSWSPGPGPDPVTPRLCRPDRVRPAKVDPHDVMS